jgi:hypothetical protein
MKKICFLPVVLIFLLFNSSLHAQIYAPLSSSISIIGKLGVMSFIPGRFDSEFKEHWETTSLLYGGEFACEVTPHIEINLGLTFVKATRLSGASTNSFSEAVSVTTEENLLTAMTSMRLIHSSDFYLLLGIGQIMMFGNIGVVMSAVEVSEDDSGLQIGIGKNLGNYLRAEIKYLYGGRNGNSGIILWFGPKVTIF